MGEIIKLDIDTRVNLSSSEILKEIATQKPKNVFVICWPDGNSLPTFHSNTSDMTVILMVLNSFIHKYYNGDFNDE